MKKLYLLLLILSGIVNAQEINIYPDGYYVCDENDAYDGFYEFDLSVKTIEILNGINPDLYSIAYYDSEQNAQTDTNPLPLLYTNTIPAEQNLYVKAIHLADNAVTMINLYLHVGRKAIAHPLPNLTAYYPVGASPLVRFNLLSQDLILMGDQNQWNTQIGYFTSLEDAENGENQITHCYYAEGTTTVWARIFLNGSGCVSYTSFTCTAIEGTDPNPSPIITFTDPNLKAKLLESSPNTWMAFDICFTGNPGQNVKIDRNDDGEIQQDEADAIYILFLDGGNISSLGGIEHFRNLDTFRCSDNNLTSVPELALLPRLLAVSLSNNHITSLDFSANPWLYALTCNGNDLTSINLKNGRNSYYYPWSVENWGNNPNLTSVCADETEIEAIQNTLIYNNYTNVEVNSYCSLDLGGNYNTITGKILFDNDANGCDASDLPQPLVRVRMDSPASVAGPASAGSTFTMVNGSYRFLVPTTGNFTITPEIENPSLFSFSPVSTVVPFVDVVNNTAIHDFCITANGFHPDVEVVIAPLTNARPGFDALYKIIYKNKGNYTYPEGTVGLQFTDDVLDFVSASQTPSTQSFGQLNWDFENLRPFEARSIVVTLNVNSPMDTPPANIGTALNFTASSYPSEADETPQDNTFNYHQTVVGSSDPNDKTCLEGRHLSPTEIGKYLHYNINFENTGNAAAENIVVKDMIDLAKYDITSLQLLNASHPVTTRITNDKVEFIFEGINLGASEHGNVTFKIRTKNTLVTGNSASNKADIYFDYNFPVATNVAMTTFDALGIDSPVLENEISFYPNPVSDMLYVNSTATIRKMELYDLRGRLLQTNSESSTINIAAMPSGIYLIRAYTDTGFKSEKVIKK